MKKQQPKYEPDAEYKVTINFIIKGRDIETEIEKSKREAGKKFITWWENKILNGD